MAARAPLVSVVLRVPGLPGPLEVLRRLVDRPRPFLRFAAAGPRDLATWSFAGSDPVETIDAANRIVALIFAISSFVDDSPPSGDHMQRPDTIVSTNNNP